MDSWGVTYKLAVDKLKLNHVQHTVIKPDGSITLLQEDTLYEILHKLMPDEVAAQDNAEHAEIRLHAQTCHGDPQIQT